MAGIGGSDLPGIAGALKSGGRCGTVKAVGFDVVPRASRDAERLCGGARLAEAVRDDGPGGAAARRHARGAADAPDGFSIDTGVVVVKPGDLEDFLAHAPH